MGIWIALIKNDDLVKITIIQVDKEFEDEQVGEDKKSAFICTFLNFLT